MIGRRGLLTGGLGALALTACTRNSPESASTPSASVAVARPLELERRTLSMTPLVRPTAWLAGDVLVLDSSQSGRLSVLDLSAGKELWSLSTRNATSLGAWQQDAIVHVMGVAHADETIVMITSERSGVQRIVAIDPRGGKVIWAATMPAQAGRPIPGVSFVDQDVVVASCVNETDVRTLVALDLATGKALWSVVGRECRGVTGGAVVALAGRETRTRTIEVLDARTGSTVSIAGLDDIADRRDWIAVGHHVGVAAGSSVSGGPAMVVDLAARRAVRPLDGWHQATLGTDVDGAPLVGRAIPGLATWRPDQELPVTTEAADLKHLTMVDGVIWAGRAADDWRALDRHGTPLGPALKVPVVAVSSTWLVENISPDSPTLTTHRITHG